MGVLLIPTLVVLLAIAPAFAACAQNAPVEQAAPNAVSPPSNRPASLTGKERLGRKWMDEQRIDNCKVPADKRGTRTRSSSCARVPTGS